MIEHAVEELIPTVGIAPACRAAGVARATRYRRRRPRTSMVPRAASARPVSARRLSAPEREAVLGVLRSPRFVDRSPAQVWATLLDEGRYLCSERTMYRLLAAAGEVRERRDQLTHPPYHKPELLAQQPNTLWSWDITKLLGPAKWTYYYLYVILDVFSRYVVAWTIQYRESASVAEQLIAQAIAQQQVPPGQLTIHADRGSAMRSKPVAFLLADLGVTKTLASVHLHGQSLLGGAVQDAQVSARLSRSLSVDRIRSGLRPLVLRLVQSRPPALRDRPHDSRGRA